MSLKFKSSDNAIIPVKDGLLDCSQLIRRMMLELDDLKTVTTVELPDIHSTVVHQILRWAKYNKTHAHGLSFRPSENEPNNLYQNVPYDFSEWETNFFNQSYDSLTNLLSAANYLSIDKLIHDTCRAIANLFQKKTLQEIAELLPTD